MIKGFFLIEDFWEVFETVADLFFGVKMDTKLQSFFCDICLLCLAVIDNRKYSCSSFHWNQILCWQLTWVSSLSDLDGKYARRIIPISPKIVVTTALTKMMSQSRYCSTILHMYMYVHGTGKKVLLFSAQNKIVMSWSSFLHKAKISKSLSLSLSFSLFLSFFLFLSLGHLKLHLERVYDVLVAAITRVDRPN